MLFPPVIHKFRYRASVEHDNEYHIKQELCFTGGGGGVNSIIYEKQKV